MDLQFVRTPLRKVFANIFCQVTDCEMRPSGSDPLVVWCENLNSYCRFYFEFEREHRLDTEHDSEIDVPTSSAE